MQKVIFSALFIVTAVVVFLFARQTFFGSNELAQDFNIRTAMEQPTEHETSQATEPRGGGIGTVPEYTEISDEVTITDGIPHLVPLEKIVGGGPPKDGIPSIDDPQFISVSEADELLRDDGLGIAVEKNGAWRFYPFQILVWHEIVNDVFDGEHVLVTYCPLCGTGIVFTPEVDGEFVEFGTSGRLFNSNLVMYDRKTDSLWSQQGGRAIVGSAVGQTLPVRSADNVFWGEFKKAYPDAQVLSTDTGAFRDYTSDPYGDYYTSNRLIFNVENDDGRLHRKAIVYGLVHEGVAKAYTEEALKRDSVVNDSLGSGLAVLGVVDPESQAVRFFDRTIQGQVLEFDLQNDRIVSVEARPSQWTLDGIGVSGPRRGVSLERLNPEFGFWFSWAAFNPGTELYQ